ncbi:MAG: acyl-ACP--UDP-N-acetylglucosamine O-acyltransferase [Deferribacteraceae bacterium]|jgi:UDP-N-acetylglucosamine acyltransferase|nr:acyl-ACP--UDP-N-acetylglucosamine O-acyltransferase [Deferribacteraceae bacterium]
MIHPTAIIDPAAEISPSAEIGALVYIGANSVIRDRVKIGVHSVIESNTEIGEDTEIFPCVCIGCAPQDTGYKGEDTYVKIGKKNVLREFVTVHRATAKADRLTEIGDNCYLMANVHIAHDCKLGNNIIMANGASLSGHVQVGDNAVFSGLLGVHQFVRIGTMAMVSALSRISKDVPAYCMVYSDTIEGLNVVGLRRNGVSSEVRAELKKALKIYLDKSIPVSEAKERLAALEQYKEIQIFRKSCEESVRGVIRKG